MTSVFYSGPTNSTFFTTCCKVAICDYQQKCPVCKKDVYPFYDGMTEAERKQAASGYYNHSTNIARSSQANRTANWRKP